MTARSLITRLALAVIAVLVLAPGAMASVSVGSGAAAPKLKVDANGNAEVSYSQGGVRKTVLVPVKGVVVYGGTLKSPDVSKAARSPKLPYLKVLRSGPGGWLYALQTWPARIGPPELRFSRWHGAPTKLTFIATRQHGGITLAGKVTYAGKPVPTISPAPGGVKIRQYVYIDQHVGGKWKVLGGVTVNRGGTYEHVFYGEQAGDGFRASVAGPNIGAVYAPDMILQIPPP